MAESKQDRLITCHSNACRSVSPLITMLFPGGIDYSNMDEWDPKAERCTGLNINAVIDCYLYIFNGGWGLAKYRIDGVLNI